ncbi:MAG TPA: hypothetical protein VK053_21180 [Jiangellaceae bacterium]|nr:hypothetical protein [Jiangellaceae bacterium]
MSDTPTHDGKPAEDVNPPSAQDQAAKGGQSGNYTPPATQADLDRIIADRISRERAKYADYDELKSAAERLAEIEEANKTEAEKQAERLAELQAKVTEYETRDQINAWKAEVSNETGVPVAALAGSTKEEIEAHAETLKPLIAQPNQPPANQPLRTIGNQPERTGSVPLKDQIAAAEKAGDKALVASLKAIQLGSTE